jgi:hypothetical protein
MDSIASAAMASAATSQVAGAHTNGTMEDADSGKRDIKSHLLFEVSTEVANRGGLDRAADDDFNVDHL